MCVQIVTAQPGYILTVKVKPVLHSDTLSLQLWQTFPTASHPTPHQLVNVCLSREEINLLGRRLIAESQ